MWIRRRRQTPNPPPSSIASDETLQNQREQEFSSQPLPVADNPKPQETPKMPFENKSNPITWYKFHPPPFNLYKPDGKPRTNLVPVVNIEGGTETTIPPHHVTKVKRHLIPAD